MVTITSPELVAVKVSPLPLPPAVLADQSQLTASPPSSVTVTVSPRQAEQPPGSQVRLHAGSSAMVTVVWHWLVQPLASVMSTITVPELVAVKVSPLPLPPAVPDHTQLTASPPSSMTVTVSPKQPKQSGSQVRLQVGSSVSMVTVVWHWLVQPLASVMSTITVPELVAVKVSPLPLPPAVPDHTQLTASPPSSTTVTVSP
jgi:hypothetical protein